MSRDHMLRAGIFRIFFVILAFAVSGCATTGSSQMKKPLIEEIAMTSTGSLSPYRSVGFEVNNQTGKYDKEIKLVEAEIANKLRNKQVFEEVYYSFSKEAKDPQLIIRMVVLSARFLDELAATWGLMTGGAGITYYLEFIDGATKNVLGRKLFEAGSGSLVELPYTENVVNKASDKAVIFIQENTRR